MHLRGIVLPAGEPGELWVADGVICADPARKATTVCDGGYILPGLVDAHCHIGIGPQGAASLAEAAAQAGTDPGAGPLLLPGRGSPSGTRPPQAPEDLPRLLPARPPPAPPQAYGPP